MNRKYIVLVSLSVAAIMCAFSVVFLYNNAPNYKKVLTATEQVTRQHYDSQGDKMGSPQHFKRSIYHRQLVWGDDENQQAER